jgi:nucleotide-binding universal stress UspA family protein
MSVHHRADREVIMFDVIVVGTDGSDAALHAVRTAGEFAQKFDTSQIHVVSGYRPISTTELNQLAAELPGEFKDLLVGDSPGTRLVDQACVMLRHSDAEVVGHPEPESGAEAILDVADEVDADLIIVGCRGEGVGKRMLHGSVSTKIAHHAPCDVLIVQNPNRN